MSSVELDERGFALIGGLSLSADYPTTPGAFQETKAAVYDAICTLLELPGSYAYGAGVSGTLGVPQLRIDDYPMIGEGINLSISNSLGAGTLAFLLVGFNEASAGFKCGELLVFPEQILTLNVPAGGLQLSATLPDDESLCETSLYLQVLEVDAGACQGVSLSPGLRLIPGGR